MLFISAGSMETFDFALPIGIGMVESTINLTRLALMDRPDIIVFVGSAGSYGDREIFDIVESNIASNIEISYLQDRSFTPIENVIKVENIIVSRETIVNSSNYITKDLDSSKRFRKIGLEIENMEFFSVLSVAKEFGIPAFGIFVITNYCNENAHNDFVKNHNRAMEILKNHIEKRRKN